MATRQHQPHEVMTAIGTVHDRVAALTAVLRDMVTHETLTTTTLAFGADGTAVFDWSAGFASVAVTNTSAQDVTLTAATVQDGAPLTGSGVALVPAGKGATYNLAGHALTLYGNPGDRVTLSVFSRPQPPAWG
jgi:hypothetical protein